MKCSSLVFKIAYDLPGVFETNPYPNVINGSLWSMKHEVRLYALLACLWVVASLTKSFKVSAFRTLVVVLALVLNGVLLAYVIAQEQVSAVLKLFSLFVSGAAYSVLKDRIPLSREVVWVLIAASVVCGVIDNLLFVVVYILSSPYVLLYVAYVPGGRIRRFNSIGDYSYGVYIYAFPVQQSLAALIPGVSPAAMFVMSLPVTLIFAVLSWHFMEARALTLKAYFSGKVRKLLPVQTLGLIERK
jgi:peptidoglycan/LPS O-acetylase OafA/YrhL